MLSYFKVVGLFFSLAVGIIGGIALFIYLGIAISEIISSIENEHGLKGSIVAFLLIILIVSLIAAIPMTLSIGR